MPNLQGIVAIVTGASRGVGKGVALGLAEFGATVYVTGRTIREGESVGSQPGTVHQTAVEVTAAGGHGIAVHCDHTDDAQTRQLFDRAIAEQGRIDILVNSAWAGYEKFHDGTPYLDRSPFWDHPLDWWRKNFDAGVRAHHVASVFAAKQMAEQKRGLIVTISSFAGADIARGPIYSAAKAADDRLIASMALDLTPVNVAAVSLYPGLVRTEGVLRFQNYFDLSNSESPQFIGRAVAHLWNDPKLLEKSGRVLVAAEIAREYGFTDVDGKQPKSLRKGS